MRNAPMVNGNVTPHVPAGFCQHSAAVTHARLSRGLPVSTAALAHLCRAGS